MILIIGLGNPGRKYIRTRHNLGFRVINQFAKENKFPFFKLSKKFNSLISKAKSNKEKIILAKPKTFMNQSGKAVKLLITHYALPVTNLWVVHDDVDLPLGKIRIVKNRGAAGHKGVQSIINKLNSKNFVRFRIGIKAELGIKNRKPQIKTEEFVLKNFSEEEEKILEKVIKKSCLVIKTAITDGIEKAMNEFNKPFKGVNKKTS